MKDNNPFRAAGTFAGTSYIERSADAKLFKAISENRRYPYILAPRQSGKSSLIGRTIEKLQPDISYRLAFIDLSVIQAANYDEFLFDFQRRIAKIGNLDENLIDLEDIGETFHSWLTSYNERLVVFIDEADSLLRFDFRTVFLSQIRSLFNERSRRPIFQRLLFVLAGAADPATLITDPFQSPFNVGVEIPLLTLDISQVHELCSHLMLVEPSELSKIARRLWELSGGLVYLCQLALENLWDQTVGKSRNATIHDLDEVLSRIVLESDKDSHFLNIYHQISGNPLSLEYFKRLISNTASEEEVRALELIGVCDRNRKPYRCALYGAVFGPDGPLSLHTFFYKQLGDPSSTSSPTLPVVAKVQQAASITEITSPVFFLTYARGDADDLVEIFFQDLCKEVRGLLGLPRNHPVGFHDAHRIKAGDHWPEALSQALSTCQILLPLYSRSFFNSEFCGKEWSAFRSRLISEDSIAKRILPILWKPLGTSFEKLPKEIRDIQYSFADLGETYRTEGVQYLLRLDEQKDNYQKFLVALAKRLTDALEEAILPPVTSHLNVEKFKNAFVPAEPTRTAQTPAVLSRLRIRDYYLHEDLANREPSFVEYRDDFLERIERICRLREPAAEIERISGEGAAWDYLRVSVRHGEIVRDYPVAGVEHDITLEDLHAFCDQIGNRFPGVVSYLVYRGNPAPEGLRSVATKRDVRLMSLIEYMGLIDFRGYVRKQTEDLTRDQLYPPSLYVPQRIVSLELKEEYPDALAKLQEWLATPSRRFAVILGDFGTGKTFLLHELARRMGLEESGPVPVLLQMRSLEKGRSLAELLGQHFAQQEPEGYRFERFRYMLEQGRIVLLIDGFDELALRVTYERAAEHFETLLSAAQGHAKIVVTSRRQHFISDQQVRSKLGEEVELISGSRIGILQPFSRGQIRAFLVNRCGSEQKADARLELIDNIKDLLGLSENPRMLGFIADLPEKQLHEAAKGGEITVATLYHIILERWLVHEFERIHPKGAPRGLSVQERWNAVTLLAVRLWQKTDRFVNLEEIQSDAAEVIRKIDHIFDEAMAAFQVGSGTLLVRDEEGNFSFLHQSILEFLVAQAAAKEIEETGASSLLAKKDLSLLMMDFLDSIAGRKNLVAWARRAAEGNDDTAKKNALLILDRLREKLDQTVDLSGQDLSGQDLSDQNLEGANLEGANLSSAKLIGSNLRGARLSYAQLRDADFTRADLSRADLSHADFSRARLLGANLQAARLGETNFTRAKLIGASLDRSTANSDLFGAASRVEGAPEGTVLFASPSKSLAWNRERGLLASAEGSLIRVWDPSSGQLLRALHGSYGTVSSVVFSATGQWLVSGASDAVVRLWDTASGQQISELRGHQGIVSSVAINKDASLIASSAWDNTVRIWDRQTGRALHLLRPTKNIHCLAFSPDGERLASASRSKAVTLWDVRSGRETLTLHGHEDWLNSVAFHPDGRSLASASDDGTVRLWDLERGEETQTLRGHGGNVYSLAFSPDGSYLASASWDSVVILWESETGRIIWSGAGHHDRVNCVAFISHEGQDILASASEDGSVRLWDVITGSNVRVLKGYHAEVHSAAIRYDGRILASAPGDNSVRLWNPVSGRQIGSLFGHASKVNSVEISQNGAFLASASDDQTIRLWDLPTGREIRAFHGHQDAVKSIAFSPQGVLLASASSDRTVRLWNIATGQSMGQGKHHRGVNCVSFSPDGETFASASDDETVRLWSVSLAKELWAFRRHDQRVDCVAFSPYNGRIIATASDDRTIRLLDTGGRELWCSQEHQRSVHCVAFSPDGRTLASASSDCTVRLWNTTDGRPIRVLEGHQQRVQSVVFGFGGKILLSASYDNTVRLWDVATGRCIVILAHLPEGWVAFTPDGRYKYGGVIAGGFWHAINLCRFEVGELDEFVPGLRLPDDASFFDLPPVPPWVEAKK